MKRRRDTDCKKIRITLDLTEEAYQRLEALEQLVDAGTKVNVVRQALQVYEYLAEKAHEGYTFRAVSPTGEVENPVFMPQPRRVLEPAAG